MWHEPSDLWRFLPIGYLLTVLLEGPVLWFGLSPGHSWRRKLHAAWWLTACTYPIVILVLPATVEAYWGRTAYVATAEIFAPVAECLLFRWAYGSAARVPNGDASLLVRPWRDMTAIVVANLVSFGVGGWVVKWWSQ